MFKKMICVALLATFAVGAQAEQTAEGALTEACIATGELLVLTIEIRQAGIPAHRLYEQNAGNEGELSREMSDDMVTEVYSNPIYLDVDPEGAFAQKRATYWTAECYRRFLQKFW